MTHDYDMNKILTYIQRAEKKKLILDTDTFNEIDDQYAVTYAMLADDIDLLALTAAPFYNSRSTSPADGMEKSYQELLHVRGLVDPDSRIPVCRGSRDYLKNTITPQESEAADTIISIAEQSDDIVFVAAIGCFTNVASALLKKPSIADKIAVILIGGNDLRHESANEFNLQQDRAAARVIFECGVPVILLPAFDCTVGLLTTNAECAFYLGNGKGGAIGEYLVSIFEGEEGDSVGEDGFCQTRQRVIWDIGSVAFLRNPGRFCSLTIADTRTVDARGYWRELHDDRKMICAEHFDRNAVFSDLFTLVRAHANGK